MGQDEEDEQQAFLCLTSTAPDPQKVQKSLKSSLLPLYWDDLALAYPEERRSELEVARGKLQNQKNYHRRRARLDPLYNDDLFLNPEEADRIVCRLTECSGCKCGSDPFVDTYIENRKASTLADTGASRSFISENFWTRIGQPKLSAHNPGCVSANKAALEVRGKRLLNFKVAGRTVPYPFWVMASAITDCIMGLDLLRYLGYLARASLGPTSPRPTRRPCSGPRRHDNRATFATIRGLSNR